MPAIVYIIDLLWREH